MFPDMPNYKTHLDRFSGEMQGTLSHWHLGDIQKGHPTIDPNSIECLPRTDIFIVPDESDKFLATFKIDINAVRPLSYNSPLGQEEYKNKSYGKRKKKIRFKPRRLQIKLNVIL